MSFSDELFKRLEREVGELHPGDTVTYHGTMLRARAGSWVVASRVGDERYLVQRPTNPYIKLNVSRGEVEKVWS